MLPLIDSAIGFAAIMLVLCMLVKSLTRPRQVGRRGVARGNQLEMPGRGIPDRGLGPWGFFYEFLGSLLTGILLSIGAPYWHDLLRALGNLRNPEKG